MARHHVVELNIERSTALNYTVMFQVRVWMDVESNGDEWETTFVALQSDSRMVNDWGDLDEDEQWWAEAQAVALAEKAYENEYFGNALKLYAVAK